MNDSQLSRYAALESRLPEGEFPRLLKLGRVWSPNVYGDWLTDYNSPKGTRPISDLERLGFAVLVLRAGLVWCLNGQPGRRRVQLAKRCQDELTHSSDPSVLSDLLTALESACPATEGGGG